MSMPTRRSPTATAAPASGKRLGELAARGDELGNHSYSHLYELARLDANIIETEIAECDRVLRAIAGPVRGFRAPGYDVSPAMLDSLARHGYRYDSSIFPAPGYYAAKAARHGRARRDATTERRRAHETRARSPRRPSRIVPR